jgi:hypothetical protein
MLLVEEAAGLRHQLALALLRLTALIPVVDDLGARNAQGLPTLGQGVHAEVRILEIQKKSARRRRDRAP